MQAAFPGGQIPAEVVVRAGAVNTPRMAAAIEELERRALAGGDFDGPVEVTAAPGGDVALISLPIAGSGTDAVSNRALASLRDDLLPATVDRVPGAESWVTGITAGTKDFNDVMVSRAPWVAAFVLTLAFVLLLVAFRSIVVPVKAIVLNLLSVGAAYGVLVWVFQYGNLESLLGFESSGGIVAWLPMFLFVILFGLSMDYHVFILSRVREAVDRGKPTDVAVRDGILSTASTVTSAAFVMVAVFAVFATLSALEFKQMGVGLAVAILIDATIVRAVLLPASMKLLGERNWYLPSWLEWLPRLSWEGESAGDEGPGEPAAGAGQDAGSATASTLPRKTAGSMAG
jgi:RND superfamily putative drug exporter